LAYETHYHIREFYLSKDKYATLTYSVSAYRTRIHPRVMHATDGDLDVVEFQQLQYVVSRLKRGRRRTVEFSNTVSPSLVHDSKKRIVKTNLLSTTGSVVTLYDTSECARGQYVHPADRLHGLLEALPHHLHHQQQQQQLARRSEIE